MNYDDAVRNAAESPEALEALCREAEQRGTLDEFAESIITCGEERPESLLLAAWKLRLQPTGAAARSSVNWRAAVPLSLVSGLAFWILSAEWLRYPDDTPFLAMVWAPLGASFVIHFLVPGCRTRERRGLWVLLGLLAVTLYVLLFTTLYDREHYRTVMALHLPLLALAGVGVTVLGRRSADQDRFAFLAKSIEVCITGGLFLMASTAFGAVCAGMFSVLSIVPPESVLLRLAACGAGLVPVLAVAFAYDPTRSPVDQDFGQSLGRLVSTLMRLLLPVVLLVLVLYLFALAFNFTEPYRNRQVLIVYNIMLFAAMACLVGITPVHPRYLPASHRDLLRKGIVAAAALAALIGV